tara:strand:- start:573 stop:836 length:264 start_codon:yes stop_codon:yes gene_type:complete
MTQKQMIELVQMHHPDMGDTEARLYLNRALKEFCRETRILSGSTTFSTVVDQRYYDLDSTVLEVTRLDVDNYRIDRLVGLPEKSDVS